jgi:predicted RNA-binding Zn ribbon-like protein
LSIGSTVRQVTTAYPGPLRGESLPVELHNTLYAQRGEPVDGLADAGGLRAWLVALRDALPADPDAIDPSRLGDFVALRAVVRNALHAALEARPVPADTVDALNAASEQGRHWLTLVADHAHRVAERRYGSADAADIALGDIAERTITLLTGPDAGRLRACGAPGCVLMFTKDHPRREWCSTACGNRARQARHYARSRPHAGGSKKLG